MKIQFHWYGFIIGIAIVVATQLIERKAIQEKLVLKEVWRVGLLALLFGVIGARLWHVATDFWLYTNDPIAILFIWNGGLSILGGVLGGIIGLFIGKKLFSSPSVIHLLDLAIFGLPVGQAIGRVANYVNQELYGLPTEGLLKIFISEDRRLPGYETVEYYHPLFFYEAIFTGLFAVVLYLLDKKKKLPVLGTGRLFITYVVYYCIVRFFLDFLRIERGILIGGVLGINQLVLLLVTSIVIFRIIKSYVSKKRLS